MKFRPVVTLAVMALTVSASLPVMASPAKEVQQSTRVLQEFTSQSTSNDSNRRIPEAILRDARGVVVLTNVTRAGFLLFGGRRGDGVLLTRTPGGTWSNPVFVSITGGSFGPQIGGSSSDLILVLTSQNAVDQLLRGRLNVGGDISAAAGPVGGQVVSPIADPRPDIYAYSRSRGLYAGVSLSGTQIDYNASRTAEYYGRAEITPQEVFTSANLNTPAEVATLRASLDRYSGNVAVQPPAPIAPAPNPNLNPVQPIPAIPPAPVRSVEAPVRGLW